MDKLNGRLSPTGHLGGKLLTGKPLSGSLTLPSVVGTEYYHGEYDFIPSEETQTIEISGLTALQNITVEPIPSNYGRIDWNGSRIKVW